MDMYEYANKLLVEAKAETRVPIPNSRLTPGPTYLVYFEHGDHYAVETPNGFVAWGSSDFLRPVLVNQVFVTQDRSTIVPQRRLWYY